jgi:hypothetical protein
LPLNSYSPVTIGTVCHSPQFPLAPGAAAIGR